MNSKWKTYAFWILLAEAVGGLSGWLTRNEMKLYELTVRKPPLSPPAAVFPIVWSILYALMGFGAARVSLTPPSRTKSRAFTLFLLQLAVNFVWSLIFFRLRSYPLAFVWLMLLWALVLWMMLTFRQVDRPAAAAQIPYLLWLTFAACLNFGVWALNR